MHQTQSNGSNQPGWNAECCSFFRCNRFPWFLSCRKIKSEKEREDIRLSFLQPPPAIPAVVAAESNWRFFPIDPYLPAYLRRFVFRNLEIVWGSGVCAWRASRAKNPSLVSGHAPLLFLSLTWPVPSINCLKKLQKISVGLVLYFLCLHAWPKQLVGKGGAFGLDRRVVLLNWFDALALDC